MAIVGTKYDFFWQAFAFLLKALFHSFIAFGFGYTSSRSFNVRQSSKTYYAC